MQNNKKETKRLPMPGKVKQGLSLIHISHIVGHAHATIVPLILLARFQDGDGVRSPPDIHASGLPAVEVGQSGGLRALGRDQDGVAHGVEIKACLHIQVRCV